MEITAIIDTGFDGPLTLPPRIVDELNLPFLWRERCTLADGSRGQTDIVSAQVVWLGEVRRIEVVVMNSYLLGTKLLEGTRLTIDYEERTVLIEKKSP